MSHLSYAYFRGFLPVEPIYLSVCISLNWLSLISTTITIFFSMFAAIILKITYDIDVTDANDEYLRLAEEVVEKTTEAQLPGRFWIEFVPFLKHLPSWVPGAEFKKFVNDMNPKIEQMLNQPWDGVKRSIVRCRLFFTEMFCTLVNP